MFGSSQLCVWGCLRFIGRSFITMLFSVLIGMVIGSLVGWHEFGEQNFFCIDVFGICVVGDLFVFIVLDGCVGYGYDTIVLVRSCDLETVICGLWNAVDRFGFVIDDGCFYFIVEEMYVCQWTSVNWRYNFNCVSGVECDVVGNLFIWMDWKDAMVLCMARVMVYIFVDEFSVVGL